MARTALATGQDRGMDETQTLPPLLDAFPVEVRGGFDGDGPVVLWLPDLSEHSRYLLALVAFARPDGACAVDTRTGERVAKLGLSDPREAAS